ncbi:hypothetical protein V2W30_41155 (plasmid) [Streptomyces sp. Q6]|uniref:Uncharacterized protein n=1 Tax=Streptomyces citrinus TaxID=3118173 RepID=A0ACD5ARL6_9ACTN
MRRPDRGTLRAAGFTALLMTVFLTVNTSVAYGADAAGSSDGLLSPLEITTSEGVSIKNYELGAQSGSLMNFAGNLQVMVLSGLFTVIRVGIGLACWAIEVAYRFPLLKLLAAPAQRLSELYTDTVVNELDLKSTLLAWAFVFGLVMVMRGKHAKGWGEIALTLVIGAVAASVFVTPNFLLGKDGPLLQTQSAAAEIAQKTVSSYSWGGKIASDDPCSGLVGNAMNKCYGVQEATTPDAEKIAKPIQDAVTNAMVVKPFMLLEYGRILDPSKPADRAAYAVHLKWVSGGYKVATPKNTDKNDPCRKIHGPAHKYCERGQKPFNPNDYPKITLGSDAFSALMPIVSKDDQEFGAFLEDLKKSGPVGKKCAAYAAAPSWWRVSAVGMVFIAALLIIALLLSAAVALTGVAAVCAGAAAAGGITWVWGMLPGPSRSVVWRWLALFGISMAIILAIATFIPAVGITIDVILTDGPDLLAERLLLIDVLALVGIAFHRRLLVLITSFGQRMTLRMRYASVGGSHLAGDSQLGAALAMSGGAGGYLATGSLRGRGATGLGLTTSSLMQGVHGGLTDGAGMPGDPRRLLADANAEASRGLAPFGLAVAGGRLAAGAAFGLLVGKRPDGAKLASLRKPTAAGDDPTAAAGMGPGGAGPGGGPGGGRLGPNGPAGGPADRYRDENGEIKDPDTGATLHDQNVDRTLLSTRAHNSLIRLRGYRLAYQGGRVLYGATMALPSTARTAASGTSTATADARQQLRVWGNTLRQDGRAWTSMLHQPAGSGPTASGRRMSPAPTSTGSAAGPAPWGTPASGVSAGSGVAGARSPRPVTGMPGLRPTAPPPRPPVTPGGSGQGAAPSGRPASAAPPSSAGPAATPPPQGSASRVPRPQPRSRPSYGPSRSVAARRDAEAMFRRILDNNARRPDQGDDGGEAP